MTENLATALIVACAAALVANVVVILELRKVQQQVAPLVRTAGRFGLT